jgi:hypothetical protein
LEPSLGRKPGAYLTGWLRWLTGWLCRATYAPIGPLPKEEEKEKQIQRELKKNESGKKERGIFNFYI